MQPKLLGTAATIVEQHLDERLKRGTWTTVDDQFRIVNEDPAAFLQIVHQRILFIGIKRGIKATELDKGVASREQVAKNQFLFAGGPRLAHRFIARDRKSTRLNSSH